MSSLHLERTLQDRSTGSLEVEAVLHVFVACIQLQNGEADFTDYARVEQDKDANITPAVV